jgi:glycosyltransferase involved in cell wall biosynthesis
MVSVITCVHNQLGMNRLFFECLKRRTDGPFQLVVIDNHSTDGTREFFSQRADVLIRNAANYSYPYCQNQGLQAATGDHLAFFNNDLLVSNHWDTRIRALMETSSAEIVSFATNNHLENRRRQKSLNRRWKCIKYPLLFIFGPRTWNFRLMTRLMYGDWDAFCERRYLAHKNLLIEGYSGSCIFMKRSVLEKVGDWDERIQSADFDLFNRAKARSLEKGDVKPVQLAAGIYFHHFERLTLRSKHEPFIDCAKLIPLAQKWGDRTKELRKDIV